MSETKDKGELLIIANLAEQAERYDGKYGLCFVSPEYLLTFSRGTQTIFGKSSEFLVLITQSESSASSYEPTVNSFVKQPAQVTKSRTSFLLIALFLWEARWPHG